MENEIWKNINDYNGLYQISNTGKIRSVQLDIPTILKLNNNGYGYIVVKLIKNKRSTKFYIHRLLAIHFISNPNNYIMVDHIDGDPSNNNISNLRWCNKKLNALNSKKPINNTSGYKGISFYNNRWEACIGSRNNRVRKTFKNLKDAISFRQNMVDKYYSKEFYIENRT